MDALSGDRLAGAKVVSFDLPLFYYSILLRILSSDIKACWLVAVYRLRQNEWYLTWVNTMQPYNDISRDEVMCRFVRDRQWSKMFANKSIDRWVFLINHSVYVFLGGPWGISQVLLYQRKSLCMSLLMHLYLVFFFTYGNSIWHLHSFLDN